MTDDQFQELMAQSKVLEQSGRHEEAIRIFQTMVDGAPSVEDRLWAAGLVASIINFNYQHLVKPGTSHYKDLHKYLRIALESYDQAHPAAQELYRNMPNDIPGLRRLLSLMDQGQPVDLSQRKSGCFIVTAAYGTPLAPEVLSLCRLRDEVLLRVGIGEAIVKIYYLVSPPLASIIASAKPLRFITRNVFVRLLLLAMRPAHRLLARPQNLNPENSCDALSVDSDK